MACGGCKNKTSKRHNKSESDLKKYAYLSPGQIRYLRSLEGDGGEKPEGDVDPKEGQE